MYCVCCVFCVVCCVLFVLCDLCVCVCVWVCVWVCVYLVCWLLCVQQCVVCACTCLGGVCVCLKLQAQSKIPQSVFFSHSNSSSPRAQKTPFNTSLIGNLYVNDVLVQSNPIPRGVGARVAHQCDYVNFSISGTVSVPGLPPIECKRSDTVQQMLFRTEPAPMGFTMDDINLISNPGESLVFQVTFRDTPDNGGCANVSYVFAFMSIGYPVRELSSLLFVCVCVLCVCVLCVCCVCVVFSLCTSGFYQGCNQGCMWVCGCVLAPNIIIIAMLCWVVFALRKRAFIMGVLYETVCVLRMCIRVVES